MNLSVQPLTESRLGSKLGEIAQNISQLSSEYLKDGDIPVSFPAGSFSSQQVPDTPDFQGRDLSMPCLTKATETLGAQVWASLGLRAGTVHSPEGY